MQIVNVKDTGLVNVEKMLKKPAFDQVELNPKIREANKQLFGRDMTAAEIV
ncbi:MAG TPA: histidinol dehydrogenase, partial [Anaerovibrio sp.]|nr:histidinol dehydrogenase [Anaerovibrio sp.]